MHLSHLDTFTRCSDNTNVICSNISNKSTDGNQTKEEEMTENSVDTEKKENNEKEDNSLSVEKHNNSSISHNDHQESDDKSISRDDCPIVEPKTCNAKESGDPTAIVDKSAIDNTKGLTSSIQDTVILDNVNECGLLPSPVVVAGSNICASDPKQVKDKPSVEVEARDDSSSKGKDELNKTEDVVASPATVKEQKQSETLENGKMGGTSSVFSSSKLFVPKQ